MLLRSGIPGDPALANMKMLPRFRFQSIPRRRHWPAPLLVLALGACSALPPVAPPAQVTPRQTVPAPPVTAPLPAAPAAPAKAAPAAPPQEDSRETPAERRPDAQVRFVGATERIDEASQRALAAVVQRWSRDKSQWITLRAHSDAAGSREYAQARALQDSLQVEARLVELGIPEKRIRAHSHARRSSADTERQVDVFLDQFRPD